MIGIFNNKKKTNPEEKRKQAHIEIREINRELRKILREYQNSLKDKKSFYMYLESSLNSEIVYSPEIRNKHGSITKMGATLIGGVVGYAATSGVKTVYNPEVKIDVLREGFFGKLTFNEDLFELTPINKGATLRIPFESIRKIQLLKHDPNNFKSLENFHVLTFLDLSDLISSYGHVYLAIYTHYGDVLEIKVYNSVISSKDLDLHEYKHYYTMVNPDGYSNFETWFIGTQNETVSALFEKLWNFDKDLALKICKSYLETGYLMNESLEKCLKDFFKLEFEIVDSKPLMV